jgi:hypothetical protein
MLVPLSPPPGLNSDDTTFAAEGRWAAGNNVRFVNGKPQTIGRQFSVFTIPAAHGVCTSILPFNRGGITTIAYGFSRTASKLFVGTELSAPSDRTPVGAPSTDNWSLAPWGSTLLASPQGGTLYEQTGVNIAAEVTQAPNKITNMLVTSERQVLALGCNEEASGTFNALCIRGCDLEDYTNWTTSPTNNAFEHILDGSGAIVAGRLIGQYVAVWTTNALYLGQFIGDPSQTYRFDRVDDCGLIGPNAVAVHDQTAYWVGPDSRIRTWSPGGRPQIVPCPVSNELADMAPSSEKYISASTNSRYNEIRFDFQKTSGLLYPAGSRVNRYISVCLQDSSWHTGAGGRTAIVDDGAILPIATADGPITVLACMSDSSNNTFYLHDADGEFSWSAATLAPFIKTADQYLDTTQRRVLIRSVFPDFLDWVGDRWITVYVRNRPQDEATEKGPHTLTAGANKLHVRASGKIVSIKFGSTPNGPGNFRIGKPIIDIAVLGER